MGILVLGQGLQPLSGLLADRLGGRSLTVTGLGCGAIAAALVAFTSSAASLAIVLILLGVSNSLFHPQTLAAVRHSSGDRHGIGMSVFMVGGELGRGVWPLAASLLVTAGGLGSIWVLGLPGLLTVPLLWRATTPLPPRTGHAARLEWHRHIKPLFKLVLFCGSRAVLLYAVVTYVPVLWNEQGGSLAGGAGFITILMIFGLLGNLAGGRLGDRGGRRRVIVLGMSVAILSTVGFILLPQGTWTWILIALVGAGLFATVPLTVIMGQDIAPENRSFGSGMAVGLSNALGAIGLMALGLIAGVYGVLTVLWIGIAIGAASIPLLWLMDK